MSAPDGDAEAMPLAGDLTLDASDPGFYADANREAFAYIHAHHPVYYCEATRTEPFWNACTHEAIRAIAADPDLFTTADGVHLHWAVFGALEAEAGVTLDPRLLAAMRTVNLLPAEEHTRVRAPVDGYFRPKHTEALEVGIRDVVRTLLDEIPAEPPADFMTAFADRVPVHVMAWLLGIDPGREADYKRWSDALVSSFEPGAVPDWAAAMEIVEFFAAEIEDRRGSPREDLISDLLASGLSGDEVLMWCVLLLSAGTETTANLIGGGMRLFLENPAAMAALAADVGLVRVVLPEMLRCVSPGRYIRRTATADTELEGRRVSAGDPVIMNFTVANFDPRHFPDPLRFDIERRPPDSLAFGSGAHRCVGRNLARLEGRVAFEELLARFPKIEARGPATYKPTLATAWMESLPVAFG